MAAGSRGAKPGSPWHPLMVGKQAGTWLAPSWRLAAPPPPSQRAGRPGQGSALEAPWFKHAPDTSHPSPHR